MKNETGTTMAGYPSHDAREVAESCCPTFFPTIPGAHHPFRTPAGRSPTMLSTFLLYPHQREDERR
jgi:hypothetical protein